MGIAEDVATALATPRVGKCKLAELIDELPDPEADALRLVLETYVQERDSGLAQHKRTFTQLFIIDLLRNNGYAIGLTTLKDHLGQVCSCVN